LLAISVLAGCAAGTSRSSEEGPNTDTNQDLTSVETALDIAPQELLGASADEVRDMLGPVLGTSEARLSSTKDFVKLTHYTGYVVEYNSDRRVVAVLDESLTWVLRKRQP